MFMIPHKQNDFGICQATSNFHGYNVYQCTPMSFILTRIYIPHPATHTYMILYQY